MGIENLIPLAIKLFNKLGKSKRLKAINTLDMLVESGDVGKIRKLPRKVSDGTRSLVAKGTLKDEVTQVLDDVGFERIDATISGPLGKKYNTEAGIKIIKDTQKKTLQSKRDRIDAGETLAPEEMDYQTKIYFYMTPEQRKARRMTDKAFQDRRAKIAKELGIPITHLERNPTIAQHMDWMRADKKLGKNTPIKDLQAMYGKPGVTYDDVMINKYNLQEALVEGSPDSIVDLLYSLGARDGQLASSVGHGMPIHEAIKLKNKIAPWMTDVEFVQMLNNPKSIRSELNLINTQKRPTERMLWIDEKGGDPNAWYGWEKKDLKEMDAIFKDAQVRSQFFTPEGELTSIGMQGYDIDPKKLRWWINKMADEDPFKGGDKLRLLPDKKILKSMYDLPDYSSGGLVKLLNKLKLTKKQRDLIMKTAYSPHRKPVTGPKALREKRIKDKLAKVGATKKWRYVKADDVKPRKRRTKQRPFAAGGIVSLYVR